MGAGEAAIGDLGGPGYAPGKRPSLESAWIALSMRPLFRTVGEPISHSPRAARLAMEAILRTFSSPERGTKVRHQRGEVDGHLVEGDWVSAGVKDTGAVVLYIHGSGFAVCSARTHRGLAAKISKESGLPAFVMEYRLAPEHPFPAAAEDAFATYRWLLEQGYDADRIVLAGDSAGGQLCMSVAIEARDKGLPAPAGLVLLSPLADPTFDLSEARDAEVKDPFFIPKMGRRLVNGYVGETDPLDPRLSLLKADVRGLPPILLQAGGREALVADAEALASHVTDSGGSCELQVWPGQIHVFQALFRWVPEGRAALREIGGFIRSALA